MLCNGVEIITMLYCGIILNVEGSEMIENVFVDCYYDVTVCGLL